MTGRTGYTAVTNASPFTPPTDITEVYEHFDPLIGESVAIVSDMPPSSTRPIGYHVWVENPATDYVSTADGWQDTAELTPEVLAVGSGITLSAGVTQSAGNMIVFVWRRQSVVFVQGCVNGTSGSSFTLFTLPTGYRPPSVSTMWASAGGFVQVTASGDVSTPISGTKTNLSFQGFFHV